ncbi:immunoglobulin domain-containing protein [Geothrix paludis]|uniref:immunoglobulin domain-containing protein n=1 Tax=Geothrix paludis TaxID=2922722 RepID=UPI001FABD365|nr:immunoglobulin domain-containing protein [Geothrix paludis]
MSLRRTTCNLIATTLMVGALALMAACGGGGGGAAAGGGTGMPVVQAATPVIVSQPTAQTALEGTRASFSVTATGNGTLTYQWKKNGGDLAGQTASSLVLDPVTLADAGSYAVMVTNTLNGTAATATSAAASLTVNPVATQPVITGQPAAQTVLEGAKAVFSVTATGNGALSYQWRKNGGDLAGQTASSLILDPVALADAGSFAVLVTNTLNGTAATATSAAAALTVNPVATQPVITGQPAAQTVLEGTRATFSVTATGNGTLTYQWKKNGGDLAGQMASSLILDPVALADAGGYAVVVTNTLNGTAATATSAAANLTVNPVATQPVITGQPAAQTVLEGGRATFSVTATGNGTLSYQWKKNGADLAGQTASTLVFDPVALTDAGSYAVVVTNALNGTSASTTSAAAALTVNPADSNVPVITTQPQSLTAIAPDGGTFTVSATGTGTLRYQWRKNGVDISGATQASYVVTGTDLQEISAQFSVVVTDDVGSTTSQNATLTVMAPEPTYAGDPMTVPARPLTVLPSYNVGTAFPHGAFRLGYDETLKNPAWTAYANFKFMTAFANGTRTFLADDRLAAPQVTDADYSGSGWTRGHQVMMSDLAYRYGSQAGTDSCRLSNVAPQDTDHNNNFWNNLEQVVGGSFTGSGGAWVPGLADASGRIWIYTGPVFDASPALLPGAVAPVRIPSGFWKVVVRETAPGQPKVVAVLTPNRSGLAASDAGIQQYTTSVARIEALTGLDLFPSPATPLPATFKTDVDVRGWGSHFEVTGAPNVHMVEPSWDGTATVGTSYTFQGQATSSNSTVASVRWDFGDSTTATTPNATHTYTANGTYNVTFSATDALGASRSIIRVLTVTGGNQAPTVSGVPTSASMAVDTVLDLPFTVSDDVSPLNVTFSATSSDEAVVPNSGLTFTGTMADQILHIVPAAGATGTVTLTLKVTDGDSASVTKTLTLYVGTTPPPAGMAEHFTWPGTSTVYATGDYTLSTGSWHFVTTMSYAGDANDAKNDGQGLRMKAVAGSAVWMNFDYGDAATPVSSVSVAYGVYKTDATNAKTATFSLYASNDQGATWTKIGNSVTASSNTLSTATFSGLTLTGPVRFKLAVEGTPAARLNLDDFVVQ